MHKIKADMDKVKEFFEKTLPGAVAAGTATALPEADPGHVRQEAHALRAAGHITAEENAHIQATLMAMAHEAGRHELVDAACEASAEARQLASKGLLTEEELLEIERKQQEAEQAFLRDEFPETAPAAGDEDPFSAETDTFEVLPVMEDSDDDDFTSNSPEEDDKESAVEAFPLLDDPSHSVTAWKATHRCPVTDFFGKPKVRYYIPKGAEIHSIGHVVCPKTHRLWIKFLSDDGFEEWAAATSSTGQQMLLQPVDREFRFRSRNHRVQKVYEFVSKPHEHHIITNASVKLQALFRRKKSEKHLIEEQRRQAAAIELQRAFRKTKQAAARRNT